MEMKKGEIESGDNFEWYREKPTPWGFTLNESVYVTSIIPQGLPPPNHVGARGGTKTGSLSHSKLSPDSISPFFISMTVRSDSFVSYPALYIVFSTSLTSVVFIFFLD